MHLDWTMGRHMVIKTLLMQNVGSDHYFSVLHTTIQTYLISFRLQRCCHQAFAAHMPELAGKN
jgi:hypothetical protein